MSQEDTTTTAGQEPAVTSETPQNGPEPAGGTQITDPDVLRRELDEARREAARYRTERSDYGKQVETLEAQLKAIGKALGLESDDPDPQALTSELENVRNQLRQERLANRFTALANAAGADIELTLAYLSHKGQLADLDPEAETFEATLNERIAKALEVNPKLRHGDAPSRGGSDFGQGPQNGQTRSMNDLIRGAIRRP